jgi:hypothetical protein
MAIPAQSGARSGVVVAHQSREVCHMSPDDLKVSIIVPAFNEATRLEDRIVILRQAVK